jgi:PAS domain S-box-containing protein
MYANFRVNGNIITTAAQNVFSPNPQTFAQVSATVVAIFSPGGQGGGSGVLVTPDGYALTNFHVTQGAGNFMKCGLSDGVLYDAVIVGIDPTGDVALVKLFGRDDFPFAKMGDSDALSVGDSSFAMGNPFLLATDFTPTVTFGIVSALRVLGGGLHNYGFTVFFLPVTQDLGLTRASTALAFSLAWFSWRRWHQSERELHLRVAAQQALVQRESQYRTLFMENLAGNTLAALDGAMLLCNPAMVRILGLNSPEEAVGRNLGEFYADPSLWHRHREALSRGDKLEIPLLDLCRADGLPVKAIARMLPRYSPGKGPELQVYLADISELQFTQKELADTLTENRMLSQKYLLVQEEERRNLAREMHDELGQCLNAIKLDAVAIRNAARDRLPEIETSVNAIVDISDHVYDVVRGIVQRLRPAALDALGLGDALGELVRQWRRRNPGVECALETEGEFSGLGELLNITG